jgi:hypothetical protein
LQQLVPDQQRDLCRHEGLTMIHTQSWL